MLAPPPGRGRFPGKSGFRGTPCPVKAVETGASPSGCQVHFWLRGMQPCIPTPNHGSGLGVKHHQGLSIAAGRHDPFGWSGGGGRVPEKGVGGADGRPCGPWRTRGAPPRPSRRRRWGGGRPTAPPRPPPAPTHLPPAAHAQGTDRTERPRVSDDGGVILFGSYWEAVFLIGFSPLWESPLLHQSGSGWRFLCV